MLTPKQSAVSKIDKKHSYVCALPGSGKTHVNTELCSNLLEDTSVTILNATFTRSAAMEMKSRLASKISAAKLKRITVSTLDSSIVQMAKAFFKYKNQKFKILLGAEYYLTVMRVVNDVEECDIDEALEVLDYYLSFPTDIKYESELHYRIVESYKRILKSKHEPTFDLKSLGRLMIDKMKCGEIKPYAFSYIIIDEFQDTGQIQYTWLKLHGELGSSKLIGIGDDDQALYRFSGSLGHANFVNLKKDFNADGYTLDTCFRCAPKILSFAESIINYNSYRVKKNFHASKKDNEGSINIYSHDDPIDELLPHLLQNPKNTAILCRTNRLLNDLEVFMVNEKIDYQRLNGAGGLFSDYNVLAYVKLLITVVLNKNIFSLIEVLTWLGEKENKLLFFQEYITSRNIKHPSQLDVSELLKQGLSQVTNDILINIKDWYKSGDNTEVFKAQKNIIQVIVAYFQDKRAQKRVFGFSDFVTQRIKGDTFKERVQRLDVMLNQISASNVEIDRNKVTLATMHASKGLEWPTVWVIDVSEGSVPALMKESVIESKNDESMHIEDERRLFYVACTRAEQTLNINYCESYGKFLGQADLHICNIFDAQGKRIILSDETK
ncbi:UvrD-helicase domain-containing protein [Pseudoalteromonas nigrifaciens]|uniref:UvrD-helicase domain-containing protein n=1 Tax=Pseudoalteromonas nigrifaciens TaxID=28109 RepID=UPI003FD4079F